MHVISTEQIATIAVLFVVACASTLTSAFRDGHRRGGLRLFGLGAQGGFLAVGLYCIGIDYVSSLGLPSPTLLFIGLAAFVGFTAKYQDKIGGRLFEFGVNKAIGAAIVTLQSFQSKPKEEEDNDSKKGEKQ